jgi:hypothetical protein
VPSQPGEQQGQSAGAGFDLAQLLELQMTQAIEPILADFRQNMAQIVQQEMEHALTTDATESHQGQQPTKPEATEERLPAPRPQVEQTAESQLAPQPLVPIQQPEARPEEEEGIQGRLAHRLRPLSSIALHGLEHQAEQWLQSMLVAGITAMFAETTRAAAQERAEQSLRVLLQRAFDALPESSTKQELHQQTERTLQSIVDEAFDAIFADEVRTELRSHGEHVTRALVHRDFDEALRQIQQGLRMVLQEIVSVLRRQWQRVLRLLLKMILTALEGSLSSEQKDESDDSSTRRGEQGAKTD